MPYAKADNFVDITRQILEYFEFLMLLERKRATRGTKA